MTVMAAEAGTGAVEAEGAEASTAGRTATRPRGRGQAQKRVTTRVVRATPQGRAASIASRAPAPRPRPRRSKVSGGARKLTGNYHGVVFVEFVLAVLLAAGTPLAKKNRTGVSPYAGIDMVKLLAITAVYFLLALTAATGRTQARFAAWFGGLILLAVGLNEAAHIATAVNQYLNPGPQPSPTPPPAGNASVVNAGSTAPTGLSRPVAQQPGNGLT